MCRDLLKPLFFSLKVFDLHDEVQRASCFNMFTRSAKSVHRALRRVWISATCSFTTVISPKILIIRNNYNLCVLCVSFIRNMYYVSLPDQSMYKIVWINVLVDVCMMCSR